MTATWFTGHDVTVLAWGALGALMLAQILIADIVGIRARHVPGSPVPADHANLLFRASRTVANTNESVAVFILLTLLGVLGGADATWTGYLAWAYVVSRAAYACCYYFDLRIPRSVSFGASLLVLFGMLVNGFAT